MQAQIKLNLFATLTKYSHRIPDPCPITAGATVGELLDRLEIPRNHVRLIFINGVRGTLSTPLQDGDRVGLFPPVGGG